MRIISGKYKGTKIRTYAKRNYRPTLSKVRKSIFDILGPLSNCKVLDLFAGTGILGFESLSRGASSVLFVDNDSLINKILRANTLLFSDCSITIKKMNAIQNLKTKQEFDLIFADPPYNYFSQHKRIDVDLFIDMILNKLKTRGRFVLECRNTIQISYPVRTKIFGETQICIGTKD